MNRCCDHRRIAGLSPGPAILLLGLLLSACAGSQEAFEDRVSDRNPSIRFGCDQPVTFMESGVSLSSLTVCVVPRPDPDPPVIGKLFEWSTDDIPVTVEGRSPGAVLADDVGSILQKAGCAVVTNDSPGLMVLEVGFNYLTVSQRAARWYQIQGSVTSKIEIDMRLKRANEVLWQRKSTHSKQIKVTYFLTSHMESALSGAYCDALKQIDRDLHSDDFRNALSKSRH